MESYKGNFRKVFFVGVFVLASLTNCTDKNSQHIGEWKAKEGFAELGLILEKDNHATLYFGNEVIGGSNFDIDGTDAELKYEISYDKNPIWLDLILYNKGNPKEFKRIKGIIRFITNDKMQYKMNLYLNSDRDKSFKTEDDNSFILNRVKSK